MTSSHTVSSPSGAIFTYHPHPPYLLPYCVYPILLAVEVALWQTPSQVGWLAGSPERLQAFYYAQLVILQCLMYRTLSAWMCWIYSLCLS